MTKEALLKYSASEVRHSPTLYAEFLRLYEEDGYKISGCQGCNFRSAFNSWKSENLTDLNINIMSDNKAKNTFVLKPGVSIVFVPVISETITKDSDDSLVVKFLNQDKGKHFEQRSKAFFSKIPDELIKQENKEAAKPAAKKAAAKTTATKAAPKKPAAPKKAEGSKEQ